MARGRIEWGGDVNVPSARLHRPILLEEDGDRTNDVVDAIDVVDDDDNDVDDNDDNDPVKLFQKRGKWWELIVKIPPMKMVNLGMVDDCFNQLT